MGPGFESQRDHKVSPNPEAKAEGFFLRQQKIGTTHLRQACYSSNPASYREGDTRTVKEIYPVKFRKHR
jgi:hypothetical protein